MDDLAHEEDAAIGELAARFVGVVDGPVHAVAEAKLSREADPEIPGRQRVARRLEALDQLGVIVRLELDLDLGLEAESLLEVPASHAIAHGRDCTAWDAGRPQDDHAESCWLIQTGHDARACPTLPGPTPKCSP